MTCDAWSDACGERGSKASFTCDRRMPCDVRRDDCDARRVASGVRCVTCNLERDYT